MRNWIIGLMLLFPAMVYSQGNGCGKPIWSDEFDYTGAPAAEKWGYDLGGGGWGNQELETYTNSRNNSWVENGKLYIKAIKSNGNWTSARLVSRLKGDWLYGRVEIRAKISPGKGVWSAIWMLPTDYAYGSWPNSGEIDIMENVGYDANRIYGTIHTGAYNHTLGTQKGGNIMVSTAYTDFHDYAIEWDEEKIVLYVDDKAYYTFANQHKTSQEWPFDKRFHLLMNIAIGGSWGGAQGVDANLTEAVMEIEHVRIYNLTPKKPVITGTEYVLPEQEVTYSVETSNSYNYEWSVPVDATILSGQGTNKLTVKWGKTAGAVNVALQASCDTLIAEPFHVKMLNDLQTVVIDNFSSGNLNWKVNETQTNSVSLEKEGDSNLKVNFDIKTPTNNPSVQYDFSTPQNLKDNSRMVVYLKTEAGKTPSNIRIDLIDESGLVETDNLFKPDPISATGEYVEYSHLFGTGTTTKFTIQKVKSIKIYFNYGMNGQAGSGWFSIKPIEMKNKITSIAKIALKSVNCYPNPVNEQLTIGRSFPVICIYNQQGKQVYQWNGASRNIIDTSELPEGIYLLQANDRKDNYQTKFIIRH